MSGYVEDSSGYYRPIGKKIGCVGHDCEECNARQKSKPLDMNWFRATMKELYNIELSEGDYADDILLVRAVERAHGIGGQE